MLLGKVSLQRISDFAVLSLIPLHDRDREFGWDSESQDAIYEDPHDLEMDQGLEQLVEVSFTFLQQLHVQSVQLDSQLRLLFLLFHIALRVAVEDLSVEVILFQYSHVVVDLLLHDH